MRYFVHFHFGNVSVALAPTRPPYAGRLYWPYIARTSVTSLSMLSYHGGDGESSEPQTYRPECLLRLLCTLAKVT